MLNVELFFEALDFYDLENLGSMISLVSNWSNSLWTCDIRISLHNRILKFNEVISWANSKYLYAYQ